MQRFKFLTDRVHGLLDYGIVLIFLLAPGLLGIGGTAAVQCYVTAGVQLLMTLFTDMPLGVVKLMPLKIHGTIELIVGLALIAMAWVVPELASGQLFFTLMGAVIFVVWVSSNYGDPAIQDA
ncbi:MAG TPA: hypothetical protein VHA35_24170 [Dongiaceae bacterium]|jgi:hypothetical protein|nr:hypothetical protein [Dongiaceae bacterium]